MTPRLYRRGGRWWVDVTVAGIRHRQTTGATERKDAEARVAELMRRWSTGGDSQTLEGAVQTCAQVRWAGTRGESTACYNASEAVRYWGAQRAVDSIRTRDVDSYAEHLLGRGNTGATVNRKLAALSAVLRVALERGHLQAMPVIRRLPESQGRIRWLTDDEERRLLHLMEGPGWRLTVFLLDTGVRLGEALRIRPEDIDREHGRVHIWQTKTDRPRTVPLTVRAQGLAPFETISKNAYRHQWDRARALMGLADDKQFVPHVLRHTCASRLVQRGVPLAVIKEWMGHGSIQTTMRYAHINPVQLEAARDALEPARPQLRSVK